MLFNRSHPESIPESTDPSFDRTQVRNIIASISDGIVIYNQDFRVLVFNPGAEAIFNLSANRVVGSSIQLDTVKSPELQTLTQVIYPSLAPSINRLSEPNAYPQIMDISFSEPRLELRVTTNQLINDAGEAVGFIKLIRDRTREVELVKSKSDFITVAAHQLRTPLSAVSWTFESLKKDVQDPSQRELVAIGLNASNNLLKVVESLLNIAKIEEGQFGYQFKNVELVGFLGELLARADLIARQYKVNVYFEAPPGTELPVTIDPDRLGMAVSNLIDNAIKYNVENGQVIVKIAPVPNKPFVEISIKDTGVGVPPDELKKLFTKFFRGSNAVTKETTGSGLGLFIVKNIIHRHGGEVWAESELNRGTTFRFTLPTDPSLVPAKELAGESYA